jgi:hypothetical protein
MNERATNPKRIYKERSRGPISRDKVYMYIHGAIECL